MGKNMTGLSEAGKGKVLAVCTSAAKGTRKQEVPSAVLVPDWGIEGDAHAGKWHRQVSLLSQEKVEEFNRRGGQVTDGAFGENLLVKGIDFRSLPLGTVFTTENTKLRLTQIGKECHSHCAIYHRVGTCIMPHEGVFAEVLEGGDITPGEIMKVILPEETERG